MNEISDNLRRVRAAIDAAAEDSGRSAAAVRLIAVSKKQPGERIDAAIAAGQLAFGENRVQEAVDHWGERRRERRRAVGAGLELHLIGPLQSNKAKDAVALFDVIQTVDRPKIAQTLAREFDRQDRQLPCFIEVNTGEEAAKSGILPAAADAFIAACRDEYALPVVGLMCLPPVDEAPALHFSLLREIARRNGVERLSMGMSGDYEQAVRFGATEVRVGTAIFGARDGGA